MKISKSNLLVAVISTLPWFGAGLGAQTHLGKIEVLFLISTLSFLCLLAISISNPSLTKSKEQNFLRKDPPLVRSVFFWLIVISYGVFILNTSYLLVENQFNLAYVRYSFFRAEDTLERVFWGSKYVGMFFNWIITPLAYIYILTIKKFSGKELILPSIVVISGFLLGGRFDAYRVAIIYVINFFYGNRKLDFRLNSRKTLILTFTISALFFLSIVVGANRQIYKHGSDSVLTLFLESMAALYDYHTVQFPIIYSVSDSPIQSGFLTGLLTPLYVVSRLPSPEGELYIYLDKVQYLTDDGSIANAFGTSVMFFWGFPSKIVFEMVLMFFISFFLFFYVFSRLSHERERFILVKYLIYSLFFSGFTPFMFSFSWWFSLMVIFIYSRIATLTISGSTKKGSIPLLQ
jgi:hypothetical protein